MKSMIILCQPPIRSDIFIARNGCCGRSENPMSACKSQYVHDGEFFDDVVSVVVQKTLKVYDDCSVVIHVERTSVTSCKEETVCVMKYIIYNTN